MERSSSGFIKNIVKPTINSNGYASGELFLKGSGMEIYEGVGNLTNSSANQTVGFSTWNKSEEDHDGNQNEIAIAESGTRAINSDGGGSLPGSIYTNLPSAISIKSKSEKGTSKSSQSNFTAMTDQSSTENVQGFLDPDQPVPLDGGTLLILVVGILLALWKMKMMRIKLLGVKILNG